MSGPTKENYQLLSNAIVAQAAYDYRQALCEQHSAHEDQNQMDIKKWDSEVLSLERFFTRDGIMVYTDLDGRALMNRLKRDVIRHKYNFKAVIKEVSQNNANLAS